MLTIKIIQDGVTSITESSNFAFYDETSREYKEMLLDEAVKRIIDAQMWAVKALTWGL